MSHLPTLWAITENRTDGVARMPPKVIILGDRDAVAERMGVFQQRYQVYVEAAGLSGLQQNAQKVHLSGGAYMHVISSGMQDTVYLYAEKRGGSGGVPEGFLVTYIDDRQELYRFDFDAGEGFLCSEVSGMVAGNHRKQADMGLWISWDGTGGGDVASETKNIEEAEYKTPVDDANPYGFRTGNLYCQGKIFPFLPEGVGTISGVGAYGGAVLVAVVDKRVLTMHFGSVTYDPQSYEVDTISYGGVIGTVEGVAEYCRLANFNRDLTLCCVGEFVIDIPSPKFWGVSSLQLRQYSPELPYPNPAMTVRRMCISSAFRANENGTEDIVFVVKQSTLATAKGVDAPTNTYEFGGYTDDAGGRVSVGGVSYIYKYFEAVFDAASVTQPFVTGSYVDKRTATVLVKPIIVFNKGIYPVTMYTWMRTMTQFESTVSNTYYWYRDYSNDEYVRCAWVRGYFEYRSWDEYGIGTPMEADVQHSTTVNFNGQKLVSKGGMSNWLYTVGSGQQSFISRKVINGVAGDAFLVSKLGATKTLTGVKHVGII